MLTVDSSLQADVTNAAAAMSKSGLSQLKMVVEN